MCAAHGSSGTTCICVGRAKSVGDTELAPSTTIPWTDQIDLWFAVQTNDPGQRKRWLDAAYQSPVWRYIILQYYRAGIAMDGKSVGTLGVGKR